MITNIAFIIAMSANFIVFVTSLALSIFKRLCSEIEQDMRPIIKAYRDEDVEALELPKPLQDYYLKLFLYELISEDSKLSRRLRALTLILLVITTISTFIFLISFHF